MTDFTSSIALIILNVILGIVFGVCPTIVLGIVSFVYAGENWNASCDSDWMPLPVWLVVAGVVSIVFAVVQLSVYTISLCAGLVKKTFAIPFIVLHSGLSFLYLIFLLVWVIIGGVALFKDGSNCQDDAHSLWAMSLAVFIIESVSLVAILCASGCSVLQNVKTTKS